MGDEYLKLIRMSDGHYKQIEIDCEICNRHDFELMLDKGRIGYHGQYGPISVMQCRYCGHVMLNPRYEPQFYIDYYQKVYKDVGNFGGEKPKPGFLERQIERGEAVRRFLAARHKINKGTMLDLGCSYGATTIPFRDNGWNVQGIDPEEASVGYGKRELGLPVQYGCAEMLPYSDNSMDLVICLGTLEHVYNLHNAMSQVWRVLKKNGHLFIRMRNNRPWGLIWEYYNANHYRFFSEATHRLVVMRYGFKVVEYTEDEIEGIPGHRYLVCRKTGKPSFELVERAISRGLRDSPEALKRYLKEHHQRFIEQSKGLLDLAQQCNGDLSRIAEEIDSGRFHYTILDGDRREAVKRALLEAGWVLQKE